MDDLDKRLDKMEEAIRKSSFRQNNGRANEVNYWIFDYPPERELKVRERIKDMQNKNIKGGDEFDLVVFDLYDIIIDFLEKNNFMEACYKFEKKKGLERIAKAVSNSMKINDDDSYIVQYIKDNTPENAVVFLVGVGKCFPILRSHKVLNNFQSYSQKRIDEMERLELNYQHYTYPGKKVIADGKKLMFSVVQISEPKEFYEYVSKYQDTFLDYAEDYEPVKTFFGGEQQQIFMRALDMLEIYDDSKTYIVDEELERIVAQMKAIVKKDMPYRDIPQLPDLRKKFMDAYSKVLESVSAPVMQSIEEAKKRVIEVVDTKEYAVKMKQKYIALFIEISDGAGKCNNVSVLRSYADKAEALKIRLLNEMDAIDTEIVRKKAEEEEKKKNPDGRTVDVVVKVPVKKTKNVPIKNVTHTSSWRIESKDDVEKCVGQLRKSLLAELDVNDIVNVEF